MAVIQYPWLKTEELRQKLHTALLDIAVKCAEAEQNGHSMEDDYFMWDAVLLLDGAVRLAMQPTTDSLSLEAFGNTTIDLALRWRRIHQMGKQVLGMMCDDLPLPYAQQLWSSLIILRAI